MQSTNTDLSRNPLSNHVESEVCLQSVQSGIQPDLESLIDAVTHSEGIVKIVGRRGSGKANLCRALEQHLLPNGKVSFLQASYIPPGDLWWAVATAFDLSISDDISDLKLTQALHHHLLNLQNNERQPILIIERAETLSAATLEKVRLLTNLETGSHKLLSIVLCGESKLDETLSAPELRHFRERISHGINLDPLRPKARAAFSAHWLARAAAVASLAGGIGLASVFIQNSDTTSVAATEAISVETEQKLLVVAQSTQAAAGLRTLTETASSGQNEISLPKLFENAENWLIDSSETPFCLQLQTVFSSKDQTLIAEIIKLGEVLQNEELRVYKTQIKGKSAIGILYGDYHTRTEAIEAIAALPTELRIYQPIVRSAKGIQEELANIL